MRRVLAVAGIAVLHFGISFTLFLTSFSLGMSRFDTGADPSLSERALRAAIDVLHFPVVTLTAMVLPARQLPGYIPFAMNSLVWAVLIWILVVTLLQRRTSS